MQDRRLLHESGAGRLLVGIFVLIAAIGFGWLLVDQRQGPARYALYAEFDTLGNINEATQVKLRGFTIGKVDGIAFRPVPPAGEPHFLVRLGIVEAYPVPPGTVAQIQGSGLVGEAFVDLDVTEAVAGELTPGSHIQGRADEGMKNLMEKLRDAAEKLGRAGKGLGDADLGGKLGELNHSVTRVADDLERVSSNADSLLVTSRHLVQGVEPAIQHTLVQLDQSMARLSLTLSRTDTLVAATSEDVRNSVRALRLVIERLDQVLQRIDTLVLDKQAQLDETITNLHATSAAMRELGEHPWKLITGQGDPPPVPEEER
ncbi:MlaD family protein [Candidatus Latescibacterota bacterium]